MERFDVDKEALYYLFELFKTGRIKLDPVYQRGRVWSDDLRLTLVESIRNEFPIGLIMFNVWQYADEDGAKTEHYDVVDGRQRLLEQAGEETQKIDEGIGIDRLAMLLHWRRIDP